MVIWWYRAMLRVVEAGWKGAGILHVDEKSADFACRSWTSVHHHAARLHDHRQHRRCLQGSSAKTEWHLVSRGMVRNASSTNTRHHYQPAVDDHNSIARPAELRYWLDD